MPRMEKNSQRAIVGHLSLGFHNYDKRFRQVVVAGCVSVVWGEECESSIGVSMSVNVMPNTMIDKFYIARTLYDENRTYSESQLLVSSQYIVILAEPGAGKTELLGSLAARLQTERISATCFRYLTPSSNKALVLDAFDEVSRIDPSGIFELLAKVKAIGAGNVVISSRSSEWDSAYTHRFRDFFGKPPTIVRLIAFDIAEQEQLFENYFPNEDFIQFRHEVSRFDLEPLLPNPIFLNLLANAYVESNRHFSDKISIFDKAIDHLAREVNPGIPQRGAMLLEKKIDFANEVFAKLLLSGSEGITLTEVNSNRLYPRLALIIKENTSPDCILDTRLFKPGDKPDQHLPVHRIVAEYCAARYLANRIINSTDIFGLPQCLAIIAPNSVVRDELRGMLGWMAALGNEPIQRAAIKLDPYAILANGDPSQLLPSSKRLLLQKLTEIAGQDPLFRRGDIWRTFSAAGFFTADVVDDLKPLLIGTNEQGHLRGLVLELLVGSPAIPYLVGELHALMLSPEASYHTRSLASDCLLGIQTHDHQASALQLISEASEDSLRITASIMEEVGAESFGLPFILNYLHACFPLYPEHRTLERTIGKRSFIKRFISTLILFTVEWLLDELTRDFSCVCGEKAYNCECRNGVSKIVGALLDRYFDLSSPPYDPSKIWQWVKNLNFHNQRNTDRSSAVQELQQNNGLRQGIIRLAFEHETDWNKIVNLEIKIFGGHSHGHSGLCFQAQDTRFIIDLAFEANNTVLWSRFMAIHRYPKSENERKVNELRQYMREQAKKKASFMKEWVKRNRAMEQYRYDDRKRELRYTRRSNRRKREQAEIHAKNIEYVTENREIVESGRHWSCLRRFAGLVLFEEPDKIEVEFGDASLVKSALRNCFDFIESDSLNLQNLARLQCESKYLELEIVLAAACLETFRATGSLETVKPYMLAAFRTSASSHYHAVDSEELKELMAEVDRLLFPKIEDAEKFVREYIEPQLGIENCPHPEVSWLKYQDVFKPLQEKLPIEWLQRFPNITLYAQSELFDMAAQYGNRPTLEAIIEQRCTELMAVSLDQSNDEQLKQSRIFWLVRAFYFLPEIPTAHWDLLIQDKNTVLTFNEYSSRMSRDDYKYWPTLSARKVEAILLAFSEAWPRVELPNSWGTESPAGEQAYRFLSEVIWNIGEDNPDSSLPVLDRLIADARFRDFEYSLRSIRAKTIRTKALRDFEAPSPQEIVALLDKGEVATVEGLRALLLQELQIYQAELDGSETTSKDIFYEKGERLGEVPATLRIADRMRLRLEGKGITVTPEHQLQNANRCDFTCTKIIGYQRRLLVTEVKGQWHPELYTAASEQLHKRYSIHPDAEQQGIYLVLWFGANEKVASRKNTELNSAHDLKQSIENTMPSELRGLIDVFVLDLSRSK